MNEAEYLQLRVDDQIDWYGRKSKSSQRAYRWLRVFEITAAAMIPFLTGYVENAGSVKFTIGLLGISVAIISGSLALFKFQENWVQYRSTCEALKSEKHLFLTRTAPYDAEQPMQLFVQKIESLISKETSNWSQYIFKQAKPELKP